MTRDKIISINVQCKDTTGVLVIISLIRKLSDQSLNALSSLIIERNEAQRNKWNVLNPQNGLIHVLIL